VQYLKVRDNQSRGKIARNLKKIELVSGDNKLWKIVKKFQHNLQILKSRIWVSKLFSSLGLEFFLKSRSQSYDQISASVSKFRSQLHLCQRSSI